MLFWVLSALLSAGIAWSFLASAKRGASVEDDPSVTLAKAELAEAEADLARGTLSADEAEAVKTEIKRRLIRRAPTARALQTGQGPRTTLIIAIVPVVIALGLYLLLGRPDLPDQGLELRLAHSADLYQSRPSQAEAEPKGDEFADDVGKASMSDLSLIAQLREAVAGRPDDQQGHELLANNEAAIGNYRAAWRAKDRANTLLGSVVTGQQLAEQASWMIEAAQGLVTPEAEAVLKRAYEIEPANPVVQYYLGALYMQIQRPDYAFDTWNQLYRSANPDNPVLAVLDDQLPIVAQLAGVNFTPRNDLAQPETPDIGAMVEGLYSRLMTEGGTPDDWAMLIRSLMVSDDIQRALAVLTAAKAAYADDAAVVARFQQVFDDAGLAEQ